MNFLQKLFDFLSSLKLAVITIVCLSLALASATFVESYYDTPTAQHYFYQSWWFTLILMTLGTNVLCAALSRWPWKPRHYGFVVTHAGIIILLIGTVVTQKLGTEGQLMLDTGEQSSDFQLNTTELTVYSAKTNMTAEFPVDFRFNPPSPQHPVHMAVPNGANVAVTDFLLNSVRKTTFAAGQPSDPPAVYFNISNARVKEQQWLGGDSEDTRAVELGLASFRIENASDAASLKRLLAPQKGTGYKGTLALTFPNTTASFEIAGNIGKFIDIPNTGYKLKITNYLPDATVSPDKSKLVSKDDDPINPAVEFEIITTHGVELHTVLARVPTETGLHGSTDQHIGLKPEFKFDPDKASADQLGNRLIFVAAPDGKLYANLHAKSGRDQVAELKTGTPFDTGWMGLQVQVQDFFPHAASVEKVVEAEVPKGKEGPPPALHLMVENGGQSKELWIQEREGYALILGGDNLEINYKRKTKPMGFTMKLDKFAVAHDPGTNNPAAYTSNVTWTDAPRGVVNKPDIITMNEPLHNRGWTLFQSSFSEVNGVPRISIFTVAYDPGVPIKYAGSIIMCLGIAMMFWLRGWYQNLGKTKRTIPATARHARETQSQAATPPAEEKEVALSGGSRKGRR